MNEEILNAENIPDSMEVRRSFRLLSMDVIFYLCGLAFIDQSTVLPAFLATLTKSSIVIGAIIAIKPAGLFLPQLWTAHYLRNRPCHKSFLMKVATISRAGIAMFAVTLFLTNHRLIMLAVFIAVYAAFWLSEGMAGVPWTDLVAKTIPERLRGRLFGLTQVGGGILGLLAGLFISRILGHGPAYPTNYAVLLAVSAVFFWASYISLFAVREPEGISEEHDGDFLQYLRGIRRMLVKDAQLKRLLIIQALIGFIGLSLPFYILYTGVSGRMVGIYLFIQVAGSIVWSALAGYLSDHRGPKYAIIVSILTGILASVLALLIGGSSVWLYGLVFFMVGGITASTWIGLTNFLLEIAPHKERRSYIGLANSASAPTILFPVLGGLIVQAVSYQTVFIITAAAMTTALILSLGLRSGDAAK
jgi:MFS family permease